MRYYRIYFTTRNKDPRATWNKIEKNVQGARFTHFQYRMRCSKTYEVGCYIEHESKNTTELLELEKKFIDNF